MKPPPSLERASALAADDRLDDAVEELVELSRLAIDRHRPRLAGRAARELAVVLIQLQRADDAVGVLGDTRSWLVDVGAGPVAIAVMDVAESAALRAAERSAEAFAVLARAHEVVRGLLPEMVVATLQHDLAVLTADLGRLEDSVTGFVAARETFLGGRDRLGVAAADHNLGCVLHDLGNLDDAAEYFQEARNIFLALDRSEEAAACDQNLGVVFFDLGRLEEAGRRFAVAHHRFSAAGAVHSAGECDYNLSALLQLMGHEDEARRYRRRAADAGVHAPLEIGLSGQVPAVVAQDPPTTDPVSSGPGPSGSGGSGNVGSASA